MNSLIRQTEQNYLQRTVAVHRQGQSIGSYTIMLHRGQILVARVAWLMSLFVK